MENTIILSPSSYTNALVDAILEASRDNKVLVLKPGIHLTRPGRGLVIRIGKNGLQLKGLSIVPTVGLAFQAKVQRPDNAIDPLASDDNYGLFFAPEQPSEKEWNGIKEWKTHSRVEENGETTSFEYAVIVRGVIKIDDLVLDCNMGNQGTPESRPGEHSAMLKFSGQGYTNENFQNKRIFVAFKRVSINNVTTIRGGFADDIWISRGYFRPNIEKVTISNVISKIEDRINGKRATISFSALAQHVEIKNCNIYKLEAEETSNRWHELPGDEITDENRYSFWKLNNISCDKLELAAKGNAIFMDAKKIESRVATALYQLGGVIADSTFNMIDEPIRLNRLNNLVFKNVNWIFTAYRNARGNFIGIVPDPQYDEPCSAKFIRNVFKVNGELITDEDTEFHCLIFSEYNATAGNDVTLEFSHCKFDQRFGADPKTYIAKVYAKGRWKFVSPVLMPGISLDKLTIKPSADINVVLNEIRITIP